MEPDDKPPPLRAGWEEDAIENAGVALDVRRRIGPPMTAAEIAEAECFGLSE